MDGGRQGGAAPRSSCVLGERAKTGKEGLTLQHNSRSVVNKSPDTEKANARAKAHEVSETFTVCTYGLLTDMCVTSQS